MGPGKISDNKVKWFYLFASSYEFHTKVASWFQSPVLWNFSLCIPFCQGPCWRATLAKMTLAKDLRLSCPQREWESDLLLLAAFKRPSQFQPSESRGLQPMTFESVEAREVEMSSLPLLSHHFSDLKQESRLSCKCCDAIGTSLAQSIVIVKQISSMWNGVPNYSISACKNYSPPEI